VTSLALLFFIVGCGIGTLSPLPFQSTFLDNNHHFSSAKAPSPTCKSMRIRQEWRTLSQPQREDYFNAVHCLRKQPAILANGSLFDDFPYVHKAFGSYSHKSALFLPWHRWFIHLFEEALVTHCGYAGALPYWDWTLDWEDITKSPVFDPVSGFGGDGNVTGEVTVGGGRCVIDGPFAGLEALRFDANWAPHCLSRGFLKGKVLRKMCGEDIRPEVVAKVLENESFEDFMSALEEGPHIGISTGIRGDWVKFTVPYGMLS
jgi:tyrosinase